MNSCLYECMVMHTRLKPQKKKFHYRVFMFYIDLDEIDKLKKSLHFLSHNKFNIFNFRDKDHLEFPHEEHINGRSVKENISIYLTEQGIDVSNLKIMLLTNLCTFGYQFNPVSFYFCVDENKQAVCAVAEVGNTFGEQKPYFFDQTHLRGHRFYLDTHKNFYVSPFIDHDVKFHFNLEVPGKSFASKIDDYDQKGKKVFMSTLVGKRKKLTNRNLIWYGVRFPFVTLKVVSLIHWEAFKGWRKGMPYRKKAEREDLPQEVYKPFRS